MVEMLQETQAGDSKKTEVEIYQEVLGKSSGFNQYFAFCPTNPQVTPLLIELREKLDEKDNRIKELEEQLIQFDHRKEKIKQLEEKIQTMFEMLTHMTIAAAHAQPYTKLTFQPSPHLTNDDVSSSATIDSLASSGNV